MSSLDAARNSRTPMLQVESCTFCGGRALEPKLENGPDRLHWLPGLFRVVECRDCSLLHTDPRPDAEAMTAYYPSTYASFVEHAPRSRRRRAAHRLVRIPYELRYGREERLPRAQTPRARALDVGAGAGWTLREMLDQGWEPWGVEPAPAVAHHVEALLGLPAGRIFVGSAEEAEFPDASFGLVVLSHVIEHLHDPRAVLAAIRGWLAPGGELRLQLPNALSVEARLFGRYWFGLDLPRHLHHFSPRTISALLEAEGFSVERITPEFQASSLAGSFSHVLHAVARRRVDYRPAPIGYAAAMAVAAVAAPFGRAATMHVVAVKA